MTSFLLARRQVGARARRPGPAWRAGVPKNGSSGQRCRARSAASPAPLRTAAAADRRPPRPRAPAPGCATAASSTVSGLACRCSAEPVHRDEAAQTRDSVDTKHVLQRNRLRRHAARRFTASVPDVRRSPGVHPHAAQDRTPPSRAGRPRRRLQGDHRAAPAGRPALLRRDRQGRRASPRPPSGSGCSGSIDSGVMQVVAVTDPLELGFARQAMIGIRVERRRSSRSPTRSPRSTRSTTS